LMPFNLHTAASLGITSSVRHLIERWTTLSLTSMNSITTVLYYFCIRCQVDPDSRNSGSWTAIMYASLFSHNETVLYLLEMKANVNLRNPNGKTPLMLAALCGSEETIKLLLMV
jgi:ankyrin repeat protein